MQHNLTLKEVNGDQRNNKTYLVTHFSFNFFESTLREYASTVAKKAKPYKTQRQKHGYLIS